MVTNQIFFSEVEVGDSLPKLEKKPTPVQLFRYSAVTWNAHRIHYDQNYTKTEGYPNVLVQSHLHGAFLTQLCTDWMGAKGKLKSLKMSVKRYAIPGDILTCQGTIIEKNKVNDECLVTVEIEERNQKGEVCAPGKAVIKLPYG